MTGFLLDVALPFGIVFSLMALLHCAVTRRGVAWFLIIVLLGPLGGIAYLIGHRKQLNLLPGKTPTSTSATATRRCPRCHQLVGTLFSYEDGRTTLQLCQMCKSEMDFRRSDFTLPS